MFDLDFFIRKNYARRSANKDESIEYTLRRVNDCFTKDLTTPKEIEMREKMVAPLFRTSTSSNAYLEIFSDDEIDLIVSELIDVSDLPQNNHSLTLSNINKLIKDGNSAINSTHVRPKRDFAISYFETLREWPSAFDSNQIAKMKNFIDKPKSQKFDELNDNLTLMVATLNGHRSELKKNNQDSSEISND